MRAAQKIEAKLVAEFSPSLIVVKDDSHLHAGHSGAPEGGESHFSVKIVAEKFEGLSRVARQRLVHQTLSEDLATYIHALSLDLKAPQEV
jgi:BolA protein